MKILNKLVEEANKSNRTNKTNKSNRRIKESNNLFDRIKLDVLDIFKDYI